ncbi:MAG: AlpA family phage regulatory protein [Proteobacteria bacterium]|nr:AlpA family phage regulatory protein [Pseudomonadota bacterium]
MQQRVYRMAVLATTKNSKGLLPVSPATIWRWVKASDGSFPSPFKLGVNTTVWDADEVDKWLGSKKAQGHE